MCKAVDRGMVMSDIRVMEKQGGKSGALEGGVVRLKESGIRRIGKLTS